MSQYQMKDVVVRPMRAECWRTRSIFGAAILGIMLLWASIVPAREDALVFRTTDTTGARIGRIIITGVVDSSTIRVGIATIHVAEPAADPSSLIVRQGSNGVPTAEISSVLNNSGVPTFFSVDSTGAIGLEMAALVGGSADTSTLIA